MKAHIKKAIEISDAKIQFVSLVDAAANKRQFLIQKAEDGKASFTSVGKILMSDDTTHFVTGIVYAPLTEDSHGNFMTEDEIRKAAHWFVKNGDKVDLQHSFEQVAGVTVVETYVAPCDMEVGGQAVVKGTWLMTVEVVKRYVKFVILHKNEKTQKQLLCVDDFALFLRLRHIFFYYGSEKVCYNITRRGFFDYM